MILASLFLPQIKDKLWSLRDARDVEDLMRRIRDCAPDISNITQLAILKQNVSRTSATKVLYKLQWRHEPCAYKKKKFKDWSIHFVAYHPQSLNYF